MRFPVAVLFFSLLTSTAAHAIDGAGNVVRSDIQPRSDEHDLYKRRGGGGGGGRGGGGGGGGSRGGGSSGGSSGGGGSRPGGSGTSRPANTQSTSNRGGTSPGGSGPPPAYGGGRYYGGGATVPYQPSRGRRSPSGMLPLFLIGGAALAFWPGVWLYGAYTYDYKNEFTFHNATTDKNETRPVKCGCAPYNPCSCDEAENDDYLRDLVGNGSYAALNKSVIDVGEVKGRKTLLINGTLPNGTTADGPAEAEDGDATSPAISMRTCAETIGFWPVIAAAVVAAVFMA